MSISTYELGNVLRVTGTFRNLAGTAVDPTVVKFRYRAPGQDAVTLTYPDNAALVKAGTGIYYYDIDLSAAGTWFYKFFSTGTNQAANESQFVVDLPEV